MTGGVTETGPGPRLSSRVARAVSPVRLVAWLGSKLNPTQGGTTPRQAFANAVMFGGVVYGALFLAIILVTLWRQGPAIGLASVAVAATASVGAVLGFLFGVPRPRATAQDLGQGFDTNANLISVSDWVTKIVIGLSLVQFHRIVVAVGLLRDESARVFAAPDHQSSDQAGWFGVCLVIGAAGISFLLMYQWTATRLPEVWAQSLT